MEERLRSQLSSGVPDVRGCVHATYVKLFAHVQCIPLDLLLSAEVSKISSNDRG